VGGLDDLSYWQAKQVALQRLEMLAPAETISVFYPPAAGSMSSKCLHKAKMAGQVYSFRSVLAAFFSEAVVRGQEAITHVPTGHCETLPSQDHLPTEANNWSRQADGFVIQGASRIADPHRS
jgi:hypothetical protein